jgi:WD40 repeat protein
MIVGGRFMHAATFAAIIALAMTQPAELLPAFELKGHDRPVLDVAFSADGKRLASVADDGMLRIWDLQTRTESASFKGCSQNNNRVCWTGDGAEVVTIGDDQTIRRWDVEAKKELKAIPLSDMSGGAEDIALSPDSKKLAVVARSTLRIYDLSSGAEVSRHVVHEQYGVDGVAWSPDGSMIATGGTDRKVTILEAATGAVRRLLETDGRPACLAFTPDIKTLFVSTDNRIVQQFDVATGAKEKIDLGSLPALDLHLSSDGKRLVIGGPGRGPVSLDLTTKKIREPKLESDDWVKSAAISPDAKLVIGGANGGTIYGWSVEQ